MKRKYDFLKDKYNELLLPTLFLVLSEKICVVLDVILIGILIGSNELASINLISPLLYITGIFYMLFGQGGSLLALRAKSELNQEKSNYYFTLSIIGIIIVSLIYILLLFVFADNILYFFNTPADIFLGTKEYLLTIMFFFPFNCFIIVISYFLRSDGFPKLPFYSVLIANISNIILDIVFLKVFPMGIKGAALASVLGYVIGTIYISQYLFSETRTFNFISFTKIKAKEILGSIKKVVLNTPEVSGKIFFAIQIVVFTYLCSTYYGMVGLIAFLVYDNSETLIYIVLSAIMKTMSPIVAVFYKEMDFKAVQYIISKSLKQVLIVSVPVSILFFIYPEILIGLFNITNPQYVEIVAFTIRVTSIGFIGRCVSYLFANYTQAIERNRFSFSITFLEEFVIPIGSVMILVPLIGGAGIWYAILLSETIPVLFYVSIAFYNQRKYHDEIYGLFLLQDSKLMNFTYAKNIVEESAEFDANINRIFKDLSPIFLSSMDDLCNDIFNHHEGISEIDVTIRQIKGKTVAYFIDDGDLYNPFNNEKLLNTKSIKELKENNCKLDYTSILGFNKCYIEFGELE